MKTKKEILGLTSNEAYDLGYNNKEREMLDKIELYGECAPTSRALLEQDLTNAHKPIKHSNTQAKPPILVLVGAAAKQSEKKANARAGKGR